MFPVHIEPAFRARKIRVSAISSAAVWNPLAAITVSAPVSIELRDSDVAGGDMTADEATHFADRLAYHFAVGWSLRSLDSVQREAREGENPAN